ncbi:NADPH-dependent 2,4-dienoyl-CoA reductase/sulfur reductase-like enzyme [Streptomyces ambofaciens]
MSEQTRERGQGPAAEAERRAVVVGAGMAGVQTVVALREQGFTGAVTLIGAEPHQPYDRPPLSKAVLLGTAEGSAFDVDFEALGITLRLGCEALGVRPGEHVLDTSEGPVPYDVLVLATGAEPVRLPGAEGVPGVHLLRTLDDAERLRPVLTRQHDIVVVGAGWIGAEFATAAREAGCAVTVVEAADRPLADALPAEVAAPMTAWYADAGAELRTRARVARVEPGGPGESGRVVLDDGTRLAAGAVVVGIGARPATGWLAGSGIALGAHGEVLADDRLRTSAPDVHAVGDCASFPSARYGERLLVHHWDNALQGPRTVAADIVGAPAGETPAALRPGAVLLVRAVRSLRPVRRSSHGRRHHPVARRPGESGVDGLLAARGPPGRPAGGGPPPRPGAGQAPDPGGYADGPGAADRPGEAAEGGDGRGVVGFPTVSARWQAGGVTEIDAKTDALVPAWLTVPDIAEMLGVEVTRVRQLIKEGQLIAVRRGENRALHIPAAFIDEDKVVKGLVGTLTLLRDDGFTAEEMLEWLFTPDPSLPGTPAQALTENRGTEVKRRAQALAV